MNIPQDGHLEISYGGSLVWSGRHWRDTGKGQIECRDAEGFVEGMCVELSCGEFRSEGTVTGQLNSTTWILLLVDEC